MLISIDTEIMNRMAQLAIQANDEIEKNAAIFSSIVAHDDWNCRERNTISENVEKVKMQAKKLQETIRDFSSVISSVAKQFDDEEKAIPRKYEHLDALLACTFPSVATNAGVVTTSSEGVAAIMTDYTEKVSFSSATAIEGYAYANLINPIQVLSFEEIAPISLDTVNIDADLSDLLKDTEFSSILPINALKGENNG